MSNPYPALRTVHQATSAGFRREHLPYPAGYGFPLPFGRWPSLLGLRVPLRGSALLASGLPAAPDLVGVSTFRSWEIRRGWTPSLLRGRWCPGVTCLERRASHAVWFWHGILDPTSSRSRRVVPTTHR